MAIAEIRGEAVAYAVVAWHVNEKSERWFEVEANVIPARRRMGIGQIMQTWIEARVQTIIASNTQVTKNMLYAFSYEQAVGKVKLLTKNGFEVHWYGYLMDRMLSEPIVDMALPSGLEVQTVAYEDLREILGVWKSAFSEKVEYIEATDEETREFIAESSETDRASWRIARDIRTSRIAGIVLSSVGTTVNERTGQIHGSLDRIATRHEWRGRGVAKALMARSLAALKAEHIAIATLGVDVQNPTGALRLYESMGFHKTVSMAGYRKSIAPSEPKARATENIR